MEGLKQFQEKQARKIRNKISQVIKLSERLKFRILRLNLQKLQIYTMPQQFSQLILSHQGMLVNVFRITKEILRSFLVFLEVSNLSLVDKPILLNWQKQKDCQEVLLGYLRRILIFSIKLKGFSIALAYVRMSQSDLCFMSLEILQQMACHNKFVCYH